MTFENIIKRVSQVLAAAFMFLMADGFYLSQKGFNWVDGSLVLVKPAEASVPAAAGGVVPFTIRETKSLKNNQHSSFSMFAQI